MIMLVVVLWIGALILNIFKNEPEIGELKLMAVLAHPDDESLALGGTLANYASEEGVKTYLVVATRGERGWFGTEADYPGPEALGRIRAAELAAAAQLLGLQEVIHLDYRDGELAQAKPAGMVNKLVNYLRRVRPHVVVTFDPFGGYGHPDHIAISQLTTAAVVAAVDPNYNNEEGWPAHRVSKLYYRVVTQTGAAAYQAALGKLVMEVDDVKRSFVAWPDWAITTWLDTSAYWQQVWQAVTCHQSQLPGYQALKELPEDRHRHLWGSQTYYRTFSLVNGGAQPEKDLFAGLRRTFSSEFKDGS
jgi:LmbE family N-acetylglucosaminyl deacetylase